jgi:hypothetical protein
MGDYIMAFMSKNQMLLQRQALESDMSSYFYSLLEYNLTVATMRDRFEDMYPGEEKFFEELVSELAE